MTPPKPKRKRILLSERDKLRLKALKQNSGTNQNK